MLRDLVIEIHSLDIASDIQIAALKFDAYSFRIDVFEYRGKSIPVLRISLPGSKVDILFDFFSIAFNDGRLIKID